ncbi:hypothetical protein DXG03_002939 [Asterophora parasitica]|uniref:Uncharacterized protein n=1 Tax=Asterophora parasitica TaxID=117018 RepID=A0A9P7G3I4_9AGAR|nr:hypothetical protein DXG03_002939 [Asterophora parasitica]
MSAAPRTSSKIPAILGGVMGGLALLGLLIIIILILKRRRKEAQAQRRLSFHRDMMVQHRIPLSDLEHGRLNATGPTATPAPVTIGHPAGPRPQVPNSAIVMASAQTHRQWQIDGQVRELKRQIAGISRQDRGQARVRIHLEELRSQVKWLRAQRNSPWALGDTDVPPPGLDRYLK